MVEPTRVTVDVPLGHTHPGEEQRLTDEIAARKSEDAILADRITTATRIVDDHNADIAELEARMSSLTARVARLEIVPGPEPFVADYHIAPDGSDTADGLTRATAWRSIAKAPVDKSTALWDGPGAIVGGAIYGPATGVTAVHLITAPGVHAKIKGPGQYSLRLQRADGSTIRPGEGGSITAVAAFDAVEATVNGEKPGASRRSCVQLTDCSGLMIDGLSVVAGGDFGILAQNVRQSVVVADVSDAGHGFMLKGNLGTGSDRAWFGGRAHDCNRMVRNLRNPASGQGAYGAVGFVFENSVGGGLLEGWEAENNYAPCYQYIWDGGGLELYDASGAVIKSGRVSNCEGALETGGSSGKGIHGCTIEGLVIRSAMTRPDGHSPAILIRNFESSMLTFDADVTAARVVLEVDGSGGGEFGGQIGNSTIVGTSVARPGIPTSSLRSVPTSTVVRVVEVAGV